MQQYHREQYESLLMIRNYFDACSIQTVQKFKTKISDYLTFRKEVDHFMVSNFDRLCTQNCYEEKVSACCNREGVITFFADLVINMLVSEKRQLDLMLARLQKENTGYKCVYLNKSGCIWRLKPIVCEMFVCESAKKIVFKEKPHARVTWEKLKLQEKSFKWPDKPVLFDDIETFFLNSGYSSPLMYFHNSPGLLRIKQLANSGGTRSKK